VLDEFPYLLAQSPELPSVIQAAYDDARLGGGPLFRLLLCGSAISIMHGLLSGQQALRGRAVLDVVLRPFDFRQSAEHWGIADPETAFLVHAVVGGTPGYRVLLDGTAPARTSHLGAWLADTLLSPSHAMFREADYLLTEDPAISDRALYHSVLSAIAQGSSTRSSIGAELGKADTALRHPLLVLERAGFIRRDQDLWRDRRPLLRLEDPLLRFHYAVVRQDLAAFEARETAAAWARARPRFSSRILGPHFEQLARVWTERFASARTLGGRPSVVGWTQVNDASARTRLDVDVVALGEGSAAGRVVLAIGEAKGGDAMLTPAHLGKLERGRELLGGRADTSRSKLLLFARAGFGRELRALVRSRSDVELIDLGRLYGGD
jgi:hypothetical protein